MKKKIIKVAFSSGATSPLSTVLQTCQIKLHACKSNPINI